ncbi:MAG: ATP-binding protein, partial [Treponema sp.]|nr:ATP-binding protein [Treponema sp.]
MAKGKGNSEFTITDQPILFEERFLEKYVGDKLLNDPVTAIIELIANSWDAGATEVHIQWPETKGDDLIITDNGSGISEGDFIKIWSTMAYDRTKINGRYANDNDLPFKRIAFGRNGIGRFAGFCFSDNYLLTSTDKTGNGFSCNVTSKIAGKPVALTKIQT